MPLYVEFFGALECDDLSSLSMQSENVKRQKKKESEEELSLFEQSANVKRKNKKSDDESSHSISILIVTHNQLEFTRLCIDSIREHTSEPYELIAVDNGSSDGTCEYLQELGSQLQDRDQARDSLKPSPVGMTIVANAQNRGFPAAVNQGIEAATGEYILLLNNDTVVTAGWLSALLRAITSDDEIVMAGPVSNFVSGAQQIEVPYGYPIGSHEWASETAASFAERWAEPMQSFASNWGFRSTDAA